MRRSRVDRRSRTTLPSRVRKAPGIRPGEDDLGWEIRGTHVIARRATESEAEQDPALLPFLRLLEHDVAAHPDRLRTMPEDLRQRLLTVTGGLDVDLDETIEGAVAL
ncbi:MAG TPA: type II toxin-antitoxin system PrlF family antitoxin [Longimicrobium sp.]|uniref:type II toxin-antitoxin system PrlF family antitoxin n=1 Tax=Longimicrobium sp. TaxID=2029185 RepID=UPI002ED883C1